MTKKYIVRNCVAKPSDIKASYGWCSTIQKKCCDCTDCLIKQVVEKCREELGIRYNDIDQGRNYLAEEILQLFTIEEVE